MKYKIVEMSFVASCMVQVGCHERALNKKKQV